MRRRLGAGRSRPLGLGRPHAAMGGASGERDLDASSRAVRRASGSAAATGGRRARRRGRSAPSSPHRPASAPLADAGGPGSRRPVSRLPSADTREVELEVPADSWSCGEFILRQAQHIKSRALPSTKRTATPRRYRV